MANHKSAAKRAKQNIKRNAHNRAQRSTLRTAIKKFLVAVQGKDKKTASETLPQVNRVIDKAVSKGLIHKNNGSRKKSRLAAALKKVG